MTSGSLYGEMKAAPVSRGERLREDLRVIVVAAVGAQIRAVAANRRQLRLRASCRREHHQRETKRRAPRRRGRGRDSRPTRSRVRSDVAVLAALEPRDDGVEGAARLERSSAICSDSSLSDTCAPAEIRQPRRRARAACGGHARAIRRRAKDFDEASPAQRISASCAVNADRARTLADAGLRAPPRSTSVSTCDT